MSQEDTSPEQRRTLWVGGIDSRVDEELLYELMLNAGPIKNVKIPVDKQTKKAKPYAFVQYEFEESIPYAIDLFYDTKLYGQGLRLQNRSTGAGIPPQRERYANESLQRQNSSPSLRLDQMQARHIHNPQDFQPWQSNPSIGSPLPFVNMYMNPAQSVPLMSMNNPQSFPSINGFIPAFLPPPPGMDHNAVNINEDRNREFMNLQCNSNNTNYRDNQSHRNHDTGRGDRPDKRHSNYDRREDRNRNREDRSRSNDRSRSGGYDNYDRRRR